MTQTLPCRYPGCKGPDNKPRPTQHGMCVTALKGDRIAGCQARLRTDLRRLVLDWVNLHTQLPEPLRAARTRRTTSREYGHPAEWAADTANHIAGMLGWIHDDLAERLHATPPPHPHTSETVQVRAAWTFLEPRIADLANQEWAGDTAAEVRELHTKIRARLGHTMPRYTLPTPCPSIDCGLKTLHRTIHAGGDTIECGACGYIIAEKHYPLFVRIVLDTLIDSAA